MMPNARKNAPVIAPIASEEMARVRISSGAMTALETRKNWLATNPAQSTARMRAATRECPAGVGAGVMPVLYAMCAARAQSSRTYSKSMG